MTITRQNTPIVRVALAATLLAGSAYCIGGWMWHPQGARATVVGLIGFAMLGIALWVAPVFQRGMRFARLVLGAVIVTVSVSLCAAFVVLLRNI